MSSSVPTVYLLHGEDDYEISNFIKSVKSKLGDETAQDMNVTWGDGSKFDLEALRSYVSAVPFLAPRRLVILENATKKIKKKDLQEKFIKLLNSIQPSTALLLVEDNTLKSSNWLLKWANKAGERSFIRNFPVKNRESFAQWIQKTVKGLGGDIDHEAAMLLAENVGNDSRLAASEIEKLLAYVNYSRAIEAVDVSNLVAFGSIEGDYFKLINAIATQNNQQSMKELHLLLSEREPLSMLSSLAGHFRLLIQVREILEGGGDHKKAADTLNIHPYRAQKLYEQARKLSMPALEAVHQQFFEYDRQIKTGRITPILALDLMVSALTT